MRPRHTGRPRSTTSCGGWLPLKRHSMPPRHSQRAAAFYRTEYAETGAEECRSRYRELTGETLLDPPLLPDISELIPDEPEGLDLAHVLTDWKAPSTDSLPEALMTEA